MVDLVLKPGGRPAESDHPWELCIRHHGPVETEYHTIAYVSDGMAQDIIEAGRPYWLYGEPDWEAVARKRKIAKLKIELAKAELEDADDGA